MCEIAVLDPSRTALKDIMAIAVKFNEEQGDGLGILSVQDDGEQYTYKAYKSVHPHWQTFHSFLERTKDDTWRYILHGRAMTAGDVNRQNAHPLHVDCDECEYEWVIHNGSVRQHTQKRGGLTTAGHDFTTPVDSEVIAHTVSELPDDISDHDSKTYSLSGNLNYILCSPDGILVRTTRKYHVTEEFCMTCSRRMFEDPESHGMERDTSTRFLLARPGEEIERTKITYSSSSQGSRASTTSWGGAYRNTGRSSHHPQGGSDYWDYEAGDTQEDDIETHVVEYEDLCPDYEYITAIKVAPGVIRVIDKDYGKESILYEDEQPDLYYYYADEEPPEGDESGNEVEQAVAETSAETVVNMTIDQVAEVQDDILEVMAETAE